MYVQVRVTPGVCVEPVTARHGSALCSLALDGVGRAAWSYVAPRQHHMQAVRFSACSPIVSSRYYISFQDQAFVSDFRVRMPWYMYMYMYMCKRLYFVQECCSPSAEGYSSQFRLQDEQGGRGYIPTNVWIPAEHRGGARSINVAELALKGKGLFSVSPSLVGDMENPTYMVFHFFSRNVLIFHIFLFYFPNNM